MKKPDDIFKIENLKTGRIVQINSTQTLKNLNTDLDAVTSDVMREKAKNESNPIKKKMMIKYADRWDVLHAQGLL